MDMNVSITGRTDAMGYESVKSPQALENMCELAVLMGRAGLTTKELSQRTGISINALYGYRRGKRKPTVKCYNALAEVFGWEKQLKPEKKKPAKKAVKYAAKKIEIEEAPPLPKPVKYEFAEGHRYRIYDRLNGKKPESEMCMFEYEGKDGIHHKFREVSGKWTRTYTDAQLIGKMIKEEK